jgi:hypothetical protein
MIDKSNTSAHSYSQKNATMNSVMQNSLKKMKIFQDISAIAPPKMIPKEISNQNSKPTAPLICAIGASLKSNNTNSLNRAPGLRYKTESVVHTIDI